MENNSFKVFIVDDEKDIVEWLANDIEWEAYNCEIVGFSFNAAEALHYMETHAVDLLLIDICMPDMSGLELIQCIKERFSEKLIIVISAYDKFSYLKEAYQYGIIDYCLKPIDVNELLDCIKTARAGWEERQMHIYHQDKIVFRNSIFQRLLVGATNSLRMEEQCRLAGIRLDPSAWQLAMMDLRDFEGSKCLYYLDCFRKKEQQIGYYCFLDAYMNLIFLFYDKISGDKERAIRKALRQELGDFDTFLCIGRPLQRYRQISESYRVCRDFLNAGDLFNRRIVHVGNYPYERYLNVLKNKELQQMMDCLKVSDANCMFLKCQEMVGKCRTEAKKKEELICLAVFLYNHFVSTYPDRKISIPEESLDAQSTSDKLLMWVEHYCKKLVNKKEDPDSAYHPYVKYALQKIHSNFADKELSLQELAKARCISSAYMGRLFKEETGELFGDYLLNTRLKASLKMLEDNRLNIGRIADNIGFSHQSYFNKMFRRKYGVSPTEYRRKYYEEHLI